MTADLESRVKALEEVVASLRAIIFENPTFVENEQSSKPPPHPGWREGAELKLDHLWVKRKEVEKLVEKYGVELVRSQMRELDTKIADALACPKRERDLATKRYLRYTNHARVIANWCDRRIAQNPGLKKTNGARKKEFVPVWERDRK